MWIENAKGHYLRTVRSDAEAVRWWNDEGERGDVLVNDGGARELLSELADYLDLDD